VTGALAGLWRFTPLLILAAAWELAARTGLVSQFALPALSAVMAAFVELFADELWPQTLRSLYRGGLGLGAAIVVGILSGLFMARYRPVRLLLNPLMQSLYPMPKSALIPLTIMWIGLGDASKMTLIFIGCLLPVVVSTFNATRGVDDILLWSARSLGASERQLMREIIMPAALPEILNGVRTALALAFILTVAIELIIANDGIGYLIDIFGEDGQLPAMFSAVIMISFAGFLADRLFVKTSGYLLRWREVTP